MKSLFLAKLLAVFLVLSLTVGCASSREVLTAQNKQLQTNGRYEKNFAVAKLTLDEHQNRLAEAEKRLDALDAHLMGLTDYESRIQALEDWKSKDGLSEMRFFPNQNLSTVPMVCEGQSCESEGVSHVPTV